MFQNSIVVNEIHEAEKVFKTVKEKKWLSNLTIIFKIRRFRTTNMKKMTLKTVNKKLKKISKQILQLQTRIKSIIIHIWTETIEQVACLSGLNIDNLSFVVHSLKPNSSRKKKQLEIVTVEQQPQVVNLNFRCTTEKQRCSKKGLKQLLSLIEIQKATALTLDLDIVVKGAGRVTHCYKQILSFRSITFSNYLTTLSLQFKLFSCLFTEVSAAKKMTVAVKGTTTRAGSRLKTLKLYIPGCRLVGLSDALEKFEGKVNLFLTHPFCPQELHCLKLRKPKWLESYSHVSDKKDINNSTFVEIDQKHFKKGIVNNSLFDLQ